MSLRYEPRPKALKRYENSRSFMSFRDLNLKFPVEETKMKDDLSDIKTMFRYLHNMSPRTMIDYSDLNENKYNNYDKLTNTMEEIVEHDVFIKGLQKMAHLVILTVLYSSYHKLETFTQFHKVQPPRQGKGPHPTLLTEALGWLVSKYTNENIAVQYII